MRHSGPIALSTASLSDEAVEFLKGLRPKNSMYRGWTWMADDDQEDDDKDDADSGSEDLDKDKGSKDDDTSGDDAAEQLARLKRRMEAADRRASEAEKKLKEQEDAKKDDLTKAQEQAAELEKTVKQQKQEISGLRLQVAFLTANKQDWHDSDVALKLADAEGYLEDINEDDGKVDKKALKKALERLAKEHPYLVKSEDTKKDKGPDGPSGVSAGRRSDNNKDDKARQEELRKRFPILNR